REPGVDGETIALARTVAPLRNGGPRRSVEAVLVLAQFRYGGLLLATVLEGEGPAQDIDLCHRTARDDESGEDQPGLDPFLPGFPRIARAHLGLRDQVGIRHAPRSEEHTSELQSRSDL